MKTFIVFRTIEPGPLVVTLLSIIFGLLDAKFSIIPPQEENSLIFVVGFLFAILAIGGIIALIERHLHGSIPGGSFIMIATIPGLWLLSFWLLISRFFDYFRLQDKFELPSAVILFGLSVALMAITNPSKPKT